MNVFDASGAMDSAKLIDYITTQFPGELAAMIKTRDELAVRQGALSAAQAAMEDRQKAKDELAAAQEAAAKLGEDAKADRAAAADELATARATQRAAAEQEKSIGTALAAREVDVAKREAMVDQLAAALNDQQTKLDAQAAALAEQEQALQARVKAFQEKVAALSA